MLRANKPLCIYLKDKILALTSFGALTDNIDAAVLLRATQQDIDSTMLRICDYSVYTRQDNINSGFITVAQGVRVGLCGTAVVKDKTISNIRHVTSLSFRVPRDIPHCADKLVGLVSQGGGILLCGPPCSGKTTMLRDLARSLSYTYRVSVLDERSELSGTSSDVQGYDTGLCDVYRFYPKGAALLSSIRTMSPDIVICDELGDRGDIAMLRYTLRCGVRVIASVHAADIHDLRTRQTTNELIQTGAFRYIVFLHGKAAAGQVGMIYEMRDAYH